MVQCCCGCSLRTGSFIIAVWCIISPTIAIAYAAWGIGVIEDHEDEGISDHLVESALRELKALLIVSVTLSALSLLFAILLLVGLIKKISLLLKTWIIYECIFLVLGVLASFLLLVTSASYTIKIEEVINTGLSVYCVLVVRSYYLELVSERRRATPMTLQQTAAAAEDVEGGAKAAESRTYTSTALV